MPSFCNVGEKVVIVMRDKVSGETVRYLHSNGPVEIAVSGGGQITQQPGIIYAMTFNVTTTNYRINVPHVANPGTEGEYIIDYYGSEWVVSGVGTSGGYVEGFPPLGGIDWRSNPNTPEVQERYLSWTYSPANYVFNENTGDYEWVAGEQAIGYSNTSTYLRPNFTVAPNGDSLIFDGYTEIVPMISDVVIYQRDLGPGSASGGGGEGGNQTITISKDGQQLFQRTFAGGVNYQVSCGDDCAPDEIKVWVNRSDGRFMCCRCHC